MAISDTVRFLLPAVAWFATAATCAPLAMAGPCVLIESELAVATPQDAGTAALLTFEAAQQSPFGPPRELTAAASDDASALAGVLLDEQPPMIPLPPAAWAGLITLSGVAWHTVRKSTPRRS